MKLKFIKKKFVNVWALNKKIFQYSTIHLVVLVIRMPLRKVHGLLDVVDRAVHVAVLVAVVQHPKKKNHHQHLMKISATSRNKRKSQQQHVAEVVAVEAVNQKNRNPK